MVLPGLTREQMIEVDRIMMNDLKIPIEFMMENAGYALAKFTVDISRFKKKDIHIVSGSGNNGGGGLVAARRLKAWNHDVKVFLPRGIESLRSVPFTQYERARAMGIPVSEGLPEIHSKHTFILDAYLGYGYSKRQDSISDSVFEFLSHKKNVISLDVPSGLDSDTGEGVDGINPEATLTIAFPKKGLLQGDKSHVGSLYVCDIGVPASVYESQLGIEWIEPYNIHELYGLARWFDHTPITKINRKYHKKTGQVGWNIDLI